MLIPEAATWSWLGKAYPLAVVSGSSSADVKQERVVWTLTVNSTNCSTVRGLFLRPMTSANARARLSVSSALASQPWLWCQSSQHTSEWRLVWRAGSPVKTRERGTKTSSSQTIESSSSNRLLKGDRNGFSCLTTGRRDTTRTPRAFTGTMNHRCLPLPGGNSPMLPTSRSSAKGVLVCIWILPVTTIPSAVSLTRRSATRSLSASRSRVPISGPPEA